MKFLNEYEISGYNDFLHRRHSPVAPYSEALREWRDTVNENSDGWPYFTPAVNAADKLITAVEKEYLFLRYARVLAQRHSDRPTKDELKKAMQKLTAFALSRNLPSPTIND